MKKEFIGLIVAIILLFNFGQYEAESSPELDVMSVVNERLIINFNKLALAATNSDFPEIPILLYLVEDDLVILDKSFNRLKQYEKELLRFEYLNVRRKMVIAIEAGRNFIKTWKE